MAIINAPTPATQMTIASDTGPMRSMPAPPGSLDALSVWMYATIETFWSVVSWLSLNTGMLSGPDSIAV